jgi:hypothetical protein
MPQTTTTTQLQRSYKQVANKAKRVREPLVVLSNNRPEGVYMDYQVFRDWQAGVMGRNSKGESKLGKLFGVWSKADADEFDRIVEDAFERVNPEDWK